MLYGVLSQNNTFFKIIPKLVLNTVVGDYGFNLKNFKTVVNNYGFKLKKFKTVVTIHGFDENTLV